MLKAMIEKIENMAGPKVFHLGGEDFASEGRTSPPRSWFVLNRRRTSPYQST